MKYSLNNKDKKILFELSLNARISLTTLAKKTKLSKQVVAYRIKQLEQNKVILGYHAITNVYMLGKTHYRIFIKYQNMNVEKEKEFMNYLMNHRDVVWIANFDGDLDLAILVWADNIRNFEKIYDEINEKYGIYFQEKNFSIATKIEYLKYKFLVNKNNESSLIFGDCFFNIKLDRLDMEILKELNLNGRMSLVELSNKFDSSPKVIKMRLDKLVKNKIIIGFNVKINHNLIGYTHRKVLLKLNDTSNPKIRELSAYLKNNKNVIFLVKPIGEYDFEFELMTESHQEFHEIIKDFRTKFADNIKSFSSLIHYSEPKTGQLINI